MERILELAAGNALFLEELIRSAAEGNTSEAPETVIAVLQARLSRIEPEARLTLRAASVLGETFWRNGVQRISEYWGKSEDVDVWLAKLVEIELVARLSSSRFPGDRQYAFRHALVCDAAKGLVTDADRKSGHLAAGRWLEEVGETDGIVLARHAVEAGAPDRAITFYVRAAERSIELYDFPEANARAIKAMDAGASGHTLGVLHAIRASALYSMGRWVDSAEHGLKALELLESGESYYCSTVESMMQVLPNTGDFDSYGRLAREILTIVPKPGARPAHLRAVCAQLLGHMVVGDHANGAECLRAIDRLVSPNESSPAARGYAQLFSALFEHGLGTDTLHALELAGRASRDLEEAQVYYRQSLAFTVQSFAAWRLGDIPLAERLARKGRETAAQVHDDYHRALADWYLALALSEAGDPKGYDEADIAAYTMLEQNKGPVFEASAHGVASRVSLHRLDWALAETRARKSLEQPSILPFRLIASTTLLEALLAQNRAKEAVDATREDLVQLDSLAGPVFSGVMFRVAMADALFQTGEKDTGGKVLRTALDEIEVRARHLTDAERNRMFRARPENVRARELAKVHLS
jgi:tetratricopeptide (TPR) repeat protein